MTAEAHFRDGNAHFSAGAFASALRSYSAAIEARPNYIDALCRRAETLRSLGDPAAAAMDFGKIVSLVPDHDWAFTGLMETEMFLCKWDRMYDRISELNARIDAGRLIASPLVLLMCVSDLARQYRGIRRYAASLLKPVPIVPRPRPKPHRKIRVAYVSADFRPHPVSFLAVELFERHDRDRFEVSAISYGPGDASPLRARLQNAFDHFDDVHEMSDQAIADLMRRREIDIAVDLTGYTALARPRIFAHRPAPIQVSWLGYPASTGLDCIDYVLGDEVALPLSLQPYFSERIVHLPGSYLTRDSRNLAGTKPTRTAAGLPENGFVFCCFSQSQKCTPGLFDIWMRLLKNLPSSVLWLTISHDATMLNLRRAAAARAVDPQRLIFAPQMPSAADHLARLSHADLFLDTAPYTAHATAVDALWMGVPVLTMIGNSFSARGAASVLQAAGIPELIVRRLSDYEQAAMRLATDPNMPSYFRRRLETTRSQCSLFDSDSFRRKIEDAYSGMYAKMTGTS